MDKGDVTPLAPGLYVVATPIGNLSDITFRAIEVLQQVDVIACEDTRHTRKLLDHYGLSKPTVSYHEHNEADRAQELLARLTRGERIAVVSDAGTPGISDPGYRVIRAAIGAGVAVFAVPGPAAFVAALAASGLPSDAFAFRGFLPARRGERRSALEAIADSELTEIFYEAPHRLLEALEDIVTTLGAERPVAIARELTKIHEQFFRGPASQVLEQVRARAATKGEIVLLIGKGVRVPAGTAGLSTRFAELAAQGLDEKAAIKQLAKEAGLSRDEVFRELQRRRSR
ncbi:MAG TPA: 16S rRNA (cytidine(1402)-2'-O)-methyltransferase [Terriglobales bacterium]|nr:16S rRNA (cytidine(1402)-2'-O)-methyltransferase [Terriglobales bacterium]